MESGTRFLFLGRRCVVHGGQQFVPARQAELSLDGLAVRSGCRSSRDANLIQDYPEVLDAGDIHLLNVIYTASFDNRHFLPYTLACYARCVEARVNEDTTAIPHGLPKRGPRTTQEKWAGNYT